MRSRHRKRDFTQPISFEMGDKRSLKAVMLDRRGADISLGSKSVGHVTFFDPWQIFTDFFVIKTEDAQTIKGNLVDKFDKSVLDLFNARIMIEMVCINIGYHGDYRRKVQEGSVRFI